MLPMRQDSGLTYASCAEAFAAIGATIDCTDDPSALGYTCEGIVGSNSAHTCQQFCESFGSVCSNNYASSFACGGAQTNSPQACDAQGDFYCTCGSLSQL